MCQAIARLLEVPMCGLVLPDATPYVTEIRLASSGDAVTRRKLRCARSTARAIVQTGHVVLVPDLRLTHAFRDTKVPDGVVAFAAAPLGGASSGAEAFWVADDAPRAWTDRDRARLESVGTLVATNLSQLDKGEAELAEPLADEDAPAELDSTELEAIGRLVGGIAHDFNNLLTAIKGTAQLVLHDLAPEDPIRAELMILDSAADRAARLTKQLLALGRGETARAPAPTPGKAPELVSSAAASLESGPVRTILIVEDDDAVRAFASRALERLGHRVLEAPSADAAFDLIGRSPDPIDLVLADIVMPGMSGRELAVRLSIERPDLRLLLMSGHGDEAASLEAQPDTVPFLPKPFSMNRLAASIARALGERR
ncbi:MAG: response regulator [Gemmatimonadaceae bacterium]